MEKYAFEIVEDVLEKFARSYNAKRKKQYWQMMKDIHGGTDKAVENITKGRHLDSLLAKRPSWQRDYDQQFGRYGENVNIRNNNNKRLKTPSELWDSTELYPARTIDPDIATYRTRPATGRPISFYKNDFSNELLEDGDFTSTYLKFRYGKPGGGNRSFKEMDEKAQALAKKTTPLSTNKAMSNEIPVDDIPVNDGNQAKKKSGKSMLAGLGIAGAGAGIGSSVRKAIKSKDAAKAQEKLKKKMALGAGVGVAGTLGAGAAYKHNSRDKAAFEIVDDILSK
jgi:hypothetical protein